MSNRRVKFKNIHKRKLSDQLYLKSPMSRGMKILDTLTIELQCATTKVKFKQALKPLTTLWLPDLQDLLLFTLLKIRPAKT